MPKYETLLFDVDGTLLDFHQAERTGLFSVLSQFGVACTEQTFLLYSGINDALWKRFEVGEISREDILSSRFATLFETLGVAGDSERAERAYRKALALSHELIDGAKELLERLNGKFTMYVVTNGVSETQYARLAASGLDRYFTGIFVSEDAGSQKPNPAYFTYCFARMGAFDKNKTLIIGDSLSSDILGGNNAGIATCWYNPQHLPNTINAAVTHEIAELSELCAILGV